MARVEIPHHLRPKLGPEMKMDIHWVDVKLQDGRCFFNLVVRGGRYITGHAGDSNGEGKLAFAESDIANVRRHALLGLVWPFWPSTKPS